MLNKHADKTAENKTQVDENSLSGQQSRDELTFSENNVSLSKMLKEKSESETLQEKPEPVQKKGTNTGLPDNLNSGMENISGCSIEDTKVHYNSDSHAQIQMHAYAQGSEINITSRQEKNLPHEAWLIVQQKHGRAKPLPDTD